jgi:hypothetical protein
MSAIIRIHKKTRNYSVIDNTAPQDENLSAEATGAITYLLTKPDDWHIRKGDLMRRFSIGRDKCARLLKELEQNGYLLRMPRTDPDTGMFYWESHLFEDPEMAGTIEVKVTRPKPERIKVARIIELPDGQEIEASITDDRESPHYSSENDATDEQRETMASWLLEAGIPVPETEKEWSHMSNSTVMAYLAEAKHWPGWTNINLLATEYEHLRIPAEAVTRAVRKWSLHGYRIANIAGIMEWAKELSKDPSWEPHHKNQRKVKRDKHNNERDNGTRTPKSTQQNSEAVEWWKEQQKEEA